jgi:type I restriction enzyme M protein
MGAFISQMGFGQHMVSDFEIAQITKFRALGWTQKDIAEELGLTRQVVSYQLKQLKQRTTANNVDEIFSEISNPKQDEELRLNILCSWLWEGANILRGPVEHADFKTYLFPILFLKRINDIWEEERNESIESYGEDFSENHRFQIPESARWENLRNVSVDVGLALQSSMRDIEASNFNLNGIFGDAQWTNKERFKDEMLKNIIEHFSKHKIGKAASKNDLVGQAYEWAIKKFADLENKSAGEFYTPRPVIRLMINILKPEEGASIYDPACGTGGMLLEAVRYIRENEGDIRGLYGNLFGQEKNFITSAMARANLYLHGLEDFRVAKGDTLMEPAFIESGELKKFDIVIANPPFSLKNWGHEHWSADRWGRNAYGLPPMKNGDYAWIEHMISSLKPNGRMAVVLPQGALFRMGSEGKIREKILKEDIVECIIGLAPNIFYGASVSASIVIMNKNKSTLKKNKILIVDASEQFWAAKAQNILLDEHIQHILDLYEGFENQVGESKIIELSDVQDNNWNLNISRYILPPQEPKTDFETQVAETQDIVNSALQSENLLMQLIAKLKIIERFGDISGSDEI